MFKNFFKKKTKEWTAEQQAAFWQTEGGKEILAMRINSPKVTGPLVFLGDEIGLGLIANYKSSVFYSTQACGYSIRFPNAEGVFIPLNHGNSVHICDELRNHFIGPKYGGRSDHEINDETADFIDKLLQEHHTTKPIKVNRDLYASSMEAWVHVLLDFPEKRTRTDAVVGEKYVFKAGVLIWPNSD